MVKLIAKNTVKQHQIATFIELAQGLVEATVKLDQGCIQYELFQDELDPTIFLIIEEWEDRDALQAHMESDHFKKTIPQMAELCAVPSELNFYRKLC